MILHELFCDADDFRKGFMPVLSRILLEDGKLAELLAEEDAELITTLKKNMKPKVMAAFDKLILRKRSIIETINDQLKNIFDLEHPRHRSLTNYFASAVAGLTTMFTLGINRR